MSKFNRVVTTAVASPVIAKPVAARTFEGAPAFGRDSKSELFLLAVSLMGMDGTFYEKAADRDDRYTSLVRSVALEDPEWIAKFVPWLRNGAQMRTASVVAAAEAAKALLDSGKPGARQVIASGLQRSDEPGELIAYWRSRYGRRLPVAVNRGIADAVKRSYTEYALLKWDSREAAYRFGDVIELANARYHLKEYGTWRDALYRYAIEVRHGRGNEVPESLPMIRANAALRARATSDPSALLDADALKAAGMTWEDALSLAGPKVSKRNLWTALIPSMGYMACLAEGTPVWLADGTTAPIEEVVSRRLPVLSYDKAWDTRPVKYGPKQQRDHSVGNLVPTVPSAWLNTGVRLVAAIRFVSGRVLEATYDHRWVRQRGTGRQAWEWATTADLRVGDRIPVPLTANTFGGEGDAWDGYFVGAMLGDGGMTALTPEFYCDPDDGAAAFMREYATKRGCGIREDWRGKIVRMRFPLKEWTRNPLTEILRSYDVWGKRCEVKALPARPLSREFWIGAISGLIDTDGTVHERVNAKGTVHGSVEYATVSRRLANQVSDALLRLGVTSIIRERAVRLRPRPAIQSRHPIFIVEVNRATALVRLAELLDLRIGYKAAKLTDLAERLSHVAPATSEMHGYDEAVALDRVAEIEDAGQRPTYCVTVDASNLFIANGIVTGNCLRNLRNFDEAGVPDAVAGQVAARLADPAQVAKSRQFPFRFLSAYRAVPSLRWSWPLEQALGHSLGNVPELRGRTLVLVDRSGSMFDRISEKSGLNRADTAALFGTALALRSEYSDLVEFGSSSQPVKLAKGESVLKAIGRFGNLGGTYTAEAIRRHYRDGFHSRIVIVTDEQAAGVAPLSLVPERVPVYTWNLAGYQHGHGPSGMGTRHAFGGLTDSAFRLIPMLEAGRDARWDDLFATA